MGVFFSLAFLSSFISNFIFSSLRLSPPSSSSSLVLPQSKALITIIKNNKTKQNIKIFSFSKVYLYAYVFKAATTNNYIYKEKFKLLKLKFIFNKKSNKTHFSRQTNYINIPTKRK